MSSTRTDSNEPITTDETRDTRFKEMLQQQFGENGIVLLVNQSFLFLMSLILVVAILIGLISARGSGQQTLKLVEPAILNVPAF
ncbi:GrBNV gp59-like protein [Tomelloso virus]|uniref:GrBNV gp59-like protein n=1 Tax=Tomelloso virus TaxID=2053981 RepID=A0A2H4T2X2_9VIRU|nr:GrBNV gp59-like protein [Tomelloso virus]ATY70267.1 GrBNV gp59-like protein [Tomelloso virus]